MTPRTHRVVQVGVLAALYVGAARVGLMLDPVGGFATLVWPPTGLSLAALLALGYGLWPGVTIGALVVNAWAGAPPLVAAGIALGNTLEALAGAYALRRLGFRAALDRVRDVASLTLVTAALSAVLSAAIGVASLWLGGVLPPARVGVAWGAWWLGDLMGALVVTPLLLLWGRRRRVGAEPARRGEAVALVLALVATSVFVFAADGLTSGRPGFQSAYLVFPVVLWAALRFGPRGAAAVNFGVLAVAVWGTAVGSGPFAGPMLHGSLVQLQAFMAVVTVTALVLAAAIAERRRAEEALRLLAEASGSLAASLDLEATLRALSGLIVPRLADGYALDLVREDGALDRVAVAFGDPAKAELAGELLRRFPYPSAEASGPVGVALGTGQPTLTAEASDAVGEPIAADPAAWRRLGVRSCMVVPLVARGRVLGVLSCSMCESGRRYDPADLALAQELARRAALAIDNARLFQQAEAAIRKAQAAVQVRDDFLGRASHELRTPLTAAFGMVRLLKRAAAGHLQEPPEGLIDTASRNLRTMVRLIEQLLDAAKLEAGRDPLVREPVRLEAVVDDSLQVVGAQAREKGLAIEATVLPGLVVSADRLKLEQVLVNLLANAVKFTPRGGRIGVQATAEPAGVLIRVRDTGEGIPAEHLERVFEPFYQVSAGAPPPPGDRRARRARGTGLGLAIVKRLVELHGGRVWAESEGPGRGSTFSVRLPGPVAEGQAA